MKSKDKPLEATHEGNLPIGDIDLSVAVLSDGTRIIKQSAVFRAFGRTKRGRAKHDVRAMDRPAFIDAKNLQPLIDHELDAVLKTITYTGLNGNISEGYDAEILPRLCKVYLDAREMGVLKTNQMPLARASEILLIALSKIGIIALVDEATGYQDVRVKDALSKILEKFLLESNKPYIGKFPLDFYKQIYRLNGWQWTPENAKRRPGVIGRWTNDIIYDRLAPGILSTLQERNPTTKPGQRKYKHFQFLTNDEGDPLLDRHFSGVLALMRASSSWKKFMALLNRSYPKLGDTLYLDFGDYED